MIITISGLPGAGKSTVKKKLAEHFNLKSYSIGDMRAKMAVEQNMTVDEFNASSMENKNYDTEVDEFQKKLGQIENNFIIDCLLGWYFIPQSFKIFMYCDPAVAAERIFKDSQNNPDRADEGEYKSATEVEQKIISRVKQNQARYQKWYEVDFMNKDHYDLYLDTTNLGTNETFDLILEAINRQNS